MIPMKGSDNGSQSQPDGKLEDLYGKTYSLVESVATRMRKGEQPEILSPIPIKPILRADPPTAPKRFRKVVMIRMSCVHDHDLYPDANPAVHFMCVLNRVTNVINPHIGPTTLSGRHTAMLSWRRSALTTDTASY
jgi:hypothetical protein